MGKIRHVLEWINQVRAAQREARASRAAFLYNPPQKPPRPFETDYPHGAPVDDTGRLTHDMDGRPLGGGIVAGRTTRGGADEAIPPAQYDALSEGAGGARPQSVASRLLRGDAGQLRRTINPDTSAPEYSILYDKSLRPEMQDRTVAHELGHLFDELSGEIPTAGLNKELATVYNDLNNPTLAQRRELLGSPDVDTSSARNLRNYSPAASGYRGEEAQRELMAEALRAYMADPNYAKTVAPKTAARVREYVNSNPRLRDIIQFNTLAPVGVGVGALGASPEAGAPELPEAATNPLLQLAELPGRSMPTGTAEPIENPRLHQVADLLDAARRHSPLIEHLSPVSLEGSAELLRNFGRERPLANRLLEVANLR